MNLNFNVVVNELATNHKPMFYIESSFEVEKYLLVVILEAYEWLICWLAEQTSQTHDKLMQQTKDGFFSQNHSQVYLGLSLSIAYGEVSLHLWNT